jgi:hemerythrin superfamily protein
MPQTNAFELLVRQHDEIRRLMRRVETSTGAARARSFERLRRLLAVHETAEEEIVHPLIRQRVPDGDRMIKARLAEEKHGKQILRALDRMGTAAPSFEPVFARFQAAVLEHAEREEREEFPALQASGDAELRGLAAAIKAAEAVAPTRAHPGVESATANLLVGGVVSAFDRTRDLARRLFGRGGL